MSRTLALGFAVLLHCAVTQTVISPIFAQPRRPTGQTTRPARPQGKSLRVEKVDPKLMRVLENWYRGTRQIKTLDGSHSKYTYEEVFAVEKRAIGKFYYETPDRGRITIKPATIKPGAKAVRRAKVKPHQLFALQAARAEEWVCDGRMIYQVDVANKKGQKYPIPPQGQGRNIMEGPLPFLLGMPPQKALQRYKLKLLKETETEVWMNVVPRWKRDASNYQNAKIILKKTNYYLPSAVLLLDPTGNQETVYTFYKTTVNRKPGILPQIFTRKHPTIAEYVSYVNTTCKMETVGGNKSGAKQPPGKIRISQNRNVPKKTATLPMRNLPMTVIPKLTGLSHADATSKLKALGFRVKIHKGSVASRKELVYKVQNQIPKPAAQAARGSLVHLQLYVKAVDLKRTAAKPR